MQWQHNDCNKFCNMWLSCKFPWIQHLWNRQIQVWAAPTMCVLLPPTTHRHYKFAFLLSQEDENRVKQVEERRVIYIGRISEGTTKAELRTRFEKFGTIVDISVHFRERGYVSLCVRVEVIMYRNQLSIYFLTLFFSLEDGLDRSLHLYVSL